MPYFAKLELLYMTASRESGLRFLSSGKGSCIASGSSTHHSHIVACKSPLVSAILSMCSNLKTSRRRKSRVLPEAGAPRRGLSITNWIPVSEKTFRPVASRALL